MLNLLRRGLFSSHSPKVSPGEFGYRRDEAQAHGSSPHVCATGEPDGPHVLIVDDEPSLRTVFRTTLTSEGYSVAEAGGAGSACELLETWHPDAVVLDLRMPGVGGMEWLAKVRANGSHVPAVIVSGHVTPASLDFMSQLGGCTFLPKPTTPERTRTAVADAIRHAEKSPVVPTAFEPTHRDLAQTERTLRESLEFDPNNPTLNNMLGMLLEEQDRP